MKLQHHVPARAIRSDPVTPEYQAEVDRSTDKAMAEWRRAQKRLEAAERRLARMQEVRISARSRARDLAVALELVELRREELLRIEALMKSAPAAAQYRGTRSYRPIPQPGSPI